MELRPIPRTQELVGRFLSRNWVCIPHVFHQDEADISQLEALRKELNAADTEIKLTLLPFVMKALSILLAEFPQFNTSLDGEGNLVYKKYFHIGAAVDTPNGLLVPVVRNCDTKSVQSIATEMAQFAAKARERGLSTADMAGGCMTVSSLGHIGGTGFTPIINAPQVAILGLTKAVWKQIISAPGEVDYQLRLPLSLSYDHRVINGADAARFCVGVAQLLATPESLL
ncbi:MAG: 2-oxo acid dehydrogenase subunit E2 [Pseudomonadales bacterium]